MLVTGPSASPPAVLTASTRRLREKWGFCTGAHMWWCAGTCLLHSLAGSSSLPERVKPQQLPCLGLFWWKVFSLSFFVFSQVLEMLCQSACTSLLPSAAACQLALLQATKYLGSSGRSFMILSMQSRMRVRNQRLQPTAAAIQP